MQNIVQLYAKKFAILYTLTIIPWAKNHGAKNRLNFIQMNSLNVLFVGCDLFYSDEAILCWSRALKSNGILILEATTERKIEQIALQFSPIFTFVPNGNANVWILQKEIKENADQCYNQLRRTVLEKQPLESVLTAIKNFEMVEPNHTISFFTRHKLKAQGFQQPAYDIWKTYAGRVSTNLGLLYQALGLLADGDYQRGFKEREMLLGDQHTRRTKVPPKEEWLPKRWKGESLTGKTLVVWSEFGLGDEIMFAQLAHYLKIQGAITIWMVQTPILSLVKTHPDIDQVIGIDELEKLGEFDYWVYPHEILAYIDTPFQDLPKRLPYLSVPSQKMADSANLFHQTENLKVGIVWRGDSTHENDKYRSIHNLEYIERLFKLKGIDWYCVQKACNDNETALLEKYNIPNMAKNSGDFLDTAAILKHFDLLIAVDTSVAHVAGALGAPTFLMLPYIVDWRWGMTEKTNMWYKDMVSFRNNWPSMEWDNVIEEISQALEEKVKLKKAKD
ncbi:methyltransferase type 11 [Rodentibacter abscessus]|uniref:methyltransferase type 11 n=1 Tax=Rodentibacter abscessus TaxID=3381777 RepID=UPI00399CF4B3